MNKGTLAVPAKHIGALHCPANGCSETFDRALPLIGHAWRSHHLKVTASGRIKCPQADCEMTFEKVNGLNAHMRRHKDVPTELPALAPESNKPLLDSVTCPKCSKTFKNAHGMRVHLVRMQDELHRGKAVSKPKSTVVSSEPTPANVPAQQAGEVMVINCCSNCGHDVRLQNTAELVIRQALAMGKTIREISVK